MKERYGNVKVFLNDNNLGFARANNIGIKESSGKYIILLNNDTIVTRGLIGGIVRYLKDKDIGMVGPVTNSIFNEARVDVTYSSTEGIEDFAEEYTRAHRGEAFHQGAQGRGLRNKDPRPLLCWHQKRCYRPCWHARREIQGRHV
jgi:GT2 family glycosyltransferase